MRIRRRVRMTVRVSALILTISLALDGTGIAQEVITVPENYLTQVLDEKAAKVKAEITRRGVGEKSKIRVKMRDKHQLTGRIIQIAEYSFQLRVEPTFLDDLEPTKGTVLRIPYAEVEKVRGARSRPANAAIGVLTVVAAVAILAAIVVLKADRCRRSGCPYASR